MKSYVIKNISKKVFFWILLLQVINVSINPPDLKYGKYSALTKKEDLSINEIESVCELIAEGIFDEDIPESNEDEIDTLSPSFQLYFFTGNGIKLLAKEFSLAHFSHCYSNITSENKEPLYLPPRQV
jgi:hypothetical protein